jgi:hypothetical protein
MIQYDFGRTLRCLANRLARCNGSTAAFVPYIASRPSLKILASQTGSSRTVAYEFPAQSQTWRSPTAPNATAFRPKRVLKGSSAPFAIIYAPTMDLSMIAATERGPIPSPQSKAELRETVGRVMREVDTHRRAEPPLQRLHRA